MKLHVEDASQSRRQGGIVVLVKAAIPHENRIALEPRAIGPQVFSERLAADLLLAFDQEAEVDRRTAGRKEVLDRLEGRHMVAFVVGAPSCVDVAIADLWLERRGYPFFERIRRLYVVVAVNREVWLARFAVPVGDHDRIAALVYVHHLDLHSRRLQSILEHTGG